MSFHRKDLFGHRRDPIRAQVIEFDPEGAELLKQMFVAPFTEGWKRLTAWCSTLRSHLLK